MGSTTLLVIDDEALILTSLEEPLTEAGYHVEAQPNGADAIAVLDRPDFVCGGLITDIQLGTGPDGWDVARHARERTPNLPVVYMTAGGGADWAARGVPNSTLIQKPFAVAQIIAAITNLLNEAQTVTARTGSDQ